MCLEEKKKREKRGRETGELDRKGKRRRRERGLV
jgi:hypothetical protein